MSVSGRFHAATLCAVGLVATSCMFGPTAASFRPAQDPEGVLASLRIARGHGQLDAELLAVTDTALLVLRHVDRPVTSSGEQVVLIPLQRIQVGGFAQLDATIQDGRYVGSSTATSLRLASRYPQGVSPQLLAALLRAYGQAELDVLAP